MRSLMARVSIWADVGLAVGRGRAVEEGEFLAALAVPDGLFKDVVLFPEMDSLDLAVDENRGSGETFSNMRPLLQKNTPRPEFGTRSSRYHPSWRKAPARGAQKTRLRCNGRTRRGPTGQERSACRSGGDPLRTLPPGSHQPPARLERGNAEAVPLQGVSTNYYNWKSAFVKGREG